MPQKQVRSSPFAPEQIQRWPRRVIWGFGYGPKHFSRHKEVKMLEAWVGKPDKYYCGPSVVVKFESGHVYEIWEGHEDDYAVGGMRTPHYYQISAERDISMEQDTAWELAYYLFWARGNRSNEHYELIMRKDNKPRKSQLHAPKNWSRGHLRRFWSLS